MKQERSLYYAENMDRLMHRDRFFFNNPVFMQGLGLAPIVVAATNLNNALVLGVAVLLLLTPTRVLAALLSRGNYLRFRGVTYAVTAAVLYIGVWFAANALFGVGIQAVGLYLPLLVVEPIIIKRYERPQKERVSTALRKGLITTCGFLLALFLVAALRELLGSGALFGHPVAARPPLPMAQLTCGGFILIGILAALWRWMRNLFKRVVSMEANAK